MAPRLLDALRERLRYMHYSLRTEEAYVHWVRGFVRWAGGRHHPRDMGAAEVQAFLSMLANERRVAAATHRQALSALLFLYREVLGIDMPWLQQLGRPVPHKRIPVVLTHVEVQALLARMSHKKRDADGRGSETGPARPRDLRHRHASPRGRSPAREGPRPGPPGDRRA
jgi:site-specific recombinase XerD